MLLGGSCGPEVSDTSRCISRKARVTCHRTATSFIEESGHCTFTATLALRASLFKCPEKCSCSYRGGRPGRQNFPASQQFPVTVAHRRF
ncbi:MAG: hypothetical protein JWL84_3488 [Rhodospirillales bacterium]|nr:hypothetical protein [Rhodospirillales bacterium]